MYDHNENQLIMPDEFFLPFEGRLNTRNRWVVLASKIPWAEIEQSYVKRLGDPRQGERAYPARLALGSLIIKEKLGLSDEGTVEAITENPYLQYFIGLDTFQLEAPFDASSMTHFRKRFDAEMINEINERMIQLQKASTAKPETKKDSSDDDDDDPSGMSTNQRDSNLKKKEQTHQGKLLIDATCVPANITYPTDIGLLNRAREKLESIIDKLHEPFIGKRKKPRTYRQKARKQYLAISKQRRPSKGKIRQAISQQLRYVRRNLSHIEKLAKSSDLRSLDRLAYKDLLVIQELYRQQSIMHREKTHSIQDRIVSIRQPYVRPIVRGKASAPTEFGAKLSMSLVNGFAYMDVLDWDPYHEGKYLRHSIETYKERHGYYPEAILADTIYRTRENRALCKKLGIRLSGPRLGRPPKNKAITRRQRKLERQDASERNQIEGKFGEGKRTYGLGLISACLQSTSETTIALGILTMNLSKILRDVFFSFLRIFRRGFYTVFV